MSRQSNGGAVQKAYNKVIPESGGALLSDFAALQAQGLSQKRLGNTGARLAVGARGGGAKLARKPGTEAAGTALFGIDNSGIKGVIRVEPLKEQIPEGDHRGKESVIKGELLESGQFEQSMAGKHLEKELQQLGRGEGSWSFGGSRFA